MKPVLALVTAPSLEVARSIASALLEAKLIACVNIVPGVESHYVWEGKRCVDSEVLCILKTSLDQRALLESTVKKHHPYQCPEIVFVEPTAIETNYEQWWRSLL